MPPMRPPRQNKRVNVGKSLERTDAEIDELSTIRQSDIESTKALTAQRAPGLAALLNAKLDEDESQP